MNIYQNPGQSLLTFQAYHVYSHLLFPTHLLALTSSYGAQKSNEISLLELTVCFKENFTISSEYKKNKYSNLVSACKRAGWSAQLHTLQVGSRGLVDFSSFEPILRFLKFSKPSSTSCSERCAEFALAHCLQSGVEQIQTVRWTQTYLCKCSNSFNSVFFSFDSCCLLLFSLVFSDLLILRRTSCT